MANIRKPELRDTMYTLIREWQASTIDKRNFCAQAQIGMHKFNYWLKKYKDQMPDKLPGFTSYRIIDQPSTIRLSFPNGVVAELPAGGDFLFVHQLINHYQACLP
jgi:hypothetical protein